MNIVILKSPRPDGMTAWGMLLNALKTRGHVIHHEPVDADISIVLSGKVENPLCLRGKKVLAYNGDEWQPKYYGWRSMARILRNYYDEFIDLTGTTLNQAVQKIEDYIAGCSKTVDS